MLNVLDLFSGIGGISLGLERTGGYRTVAFCEIEPYCTAVLNERWPGVPVFGDVRTLSGASLREAGVGRIDVICGGFPCQPFSVAGKQRGTEDERHLWPEYARLIRELRPIFVIAENVPGLRTIAADEVLEDLEEAGYSAEPLVVGADDVGAPHRRKRVWIVAHRNGVGLDGDRRHATPESGGDGSEYGVPRAYGAVADCDGERIGDANMADTGSEGLERDRRRAGMPSEEHTESTRRVPYRWPSRPGEPQYGWEPSRLVYAKPTGSQGSAGSGMPGARRSRSESSCGCGGVGGSRETQPGLGRDVDGLPDRLESRIRRERLKALGNSVVPQIPEIIGRAILAARAKGLC